MTMYLTQAELSDLWQISTRTLEGWRSTGMNGPGYVKFGNRVRYPRDEVERFERENFHEIVRYRKLSNDNDGEHDDEISERWFG